MNEAFFCSFQHIIWRYFKINTIPGFFMVNAESKYIWRCKLHDVVWQCRMQNIYTK